MLPLLRRRQAVIVTDEQVARHHLPALRRSLDEHGIANHAIVLPPGEGTKDLAHFGRLIDDVLAMRHRARHDAGRAGRRRGRRHRRVCRRDAAARHRFRADPDHAAGAGRQLGRRQDRDQHGGGQKPCRRLLPAAARAGRYGEPGDTAAPRGARRLWRDRQIRADPRRANSSNGSKPKGAPSAISNRRR